MIDYALLFGIIEQYKPSILHCDYITHSKIILQLTDNLNSKLDTK